MRCFLPALSALLLIGATAHAEDARTWDDRSGWTSEVGVGNGVGVTQHGVVADTTIRVGFHHVGEFHGKSLVGLEAGSMSWCMPVLMCSAVGVLVAPASGFLGNELGVDVAAHVLHGVSGDAPTFGYAVGVRPALRVARDSRFRTASYLGSLVPEVGLAFPAGRANEVYLDFSFYPLAMTLTREVAIQWDILRERIGIPLDGTKATVMAGTSFSLMLL